MKQQETLIIISVYNQITGATRRERERGDRSWGNPRRHGRCGERRENRCSTEKTWTQRREVSMLSQHGGHDWHLGVETLFGYASFAIPWPGVGGVSEFRCFFLYLLLLTKKSILGFFYHSNKIFKFFHL